MKEIQLSFNVYISNLVLKIQRILPLYVFVITVLAITFSNLAIKDFHKSLQFANVFNTSGVIAVFTPICALGALILCIMLIFILPSKVGVILNRVLNKSHLYPTIKKAELLFLLLSYIYYQAAGVFIIAGVGRLIKNFLFVSLFQMSMFSICLIVFSIMFSVLGILLLALLNICNLYGIEYLKSLIPSLVKHAKSKFIKLISPTVLYNDFKLARLLAIPLILSMIYFNCYKNFMTFFDKNYFDFITLFFIFGSLFIIGLEKIKPIIHRSYHHIIYPLLNKIQIGVRFLNSFLMVFIIVYCVFLFLEMRISIEYYADLFNKVFGLILFTVIFEIFANMIQPLSKSIHIRKIEYKSSTAKK